MTIQFPNRSRCFDGTRRAVRFWGYDSSMEVSFFVSERALQRLQPGTAAVEDNLLEAFDSHRDRILVAAGRLYVRGSRGSYDLGDKEF